MSKFTAVGVPLSCSVPSDPDQDTAAYVRAIERLLIVVQELSLARSLERIIEIVRTAARQLTHADGASFVLQDNGYCYYVDEDAIAPLWKGQRFPMETCIGGWTMRNQTPAVIEDVRVDERIPWVAYRETFVKSLVMVPIRTFDPIGAIGTYWAKKHAPTLQEIKLLQALADTTAVAMENVQVYSELEQRVRDRTVQLQVTNQELADEIQERKAAQAEVQRLSITDELTGLHNRRGFFLLAQQQLKLAQRLGNHCSLMFIDLDGLKQINDQQGHEVGDAAIQAAAQVLRHTLRETDTLARLGGDEFAALIQGDCSHTPEAVKERIRQHIDQFNQTGAGFQLAMSIGTCICNPDQVQSLDELLSLADAQMYQHKKLKRTVRHKLARQ